MRQYLLLNKDSVWLEFHCEQNEYLETAAREDVWHTDQRPFGYTNPTDFLERRKAPKHRAHIAELLKEYGCETLDGYLDVTHALSLNDTFWVKPTDSPLTWAEVSLYRNPFNAVISAAAFDGSMSSSGFSSTSPEFSTDGQYAKCWVRENDIIQLYKTGSASGTALPRLGSDFIATARGLLTDEILPDLKNLKDFRFSSHPEISIEPERLDRLNTILQFQLGKILA